MEVKTQLVPFLGLLSYTFGLFLLINLPLGIRFSPGGAALDVTAIKAAILVLIFLAILALVYSVRKRRKEK